MKRTLLSATVLATLLVVPAVSLTTADAAPTPTNELTLLRTVKVRMDGDASLDTVQLFQVGKINFRLQVTTAKTTFAGEKPGRYWVDGSADDADSLVFSVVNGVATAQAISAYGDVDNCYDVATSQWQTDKWVLAGYQECLASVTPEFTDGIVADFVN